MNFYSQWDLHFYSPLKSTTSFQNVGTVFAQKSLKQSGSAYMTQHGAGTVHSIRWHHRLMGIKPIDKWCCRWRWRHQRRWRWCCRRVNAPIAINAAALTEWIVIDQKLLFSSLHGTFWLVYMTLSENRPCSGCGTIKPIRELVALLPHGQFSLISSLTNQESLCHCWHKNYQCSNSLMASLVVLEVVQRCIEQKMYPESGITSENR